MNSSVPVLFILDLKPVVKTVKNANNAKELNLDIYKSNRVLKNLYNNSIEVYYNTSDIEELDIFSNLFTNDRDVYIFYRKYITESYTYLGKMSELSLINYKNRNDNSKYFNVLIDKSCNYKIPNKTNDKKLDILEYLGFTNLNNNELKKINNQTIFDLNDIFY